MKDYRGSRLKRFDPRRDIPGAACILDLDVANIPAAVDGAGVSVWPDASGHGNTVTQHASSSRPVYRASGTATGPALDFASGKFMRRETFGVWPAEHGQPVTAWIVAKVPSGGSGDRPIIGGGSTRFDFGVTSAGLLGATAGTYIASGEAIDDDEWHVLAVTLSSEYSATFVDGRLEYATFNQAQGTNAWSDLGVGAQAGGSAPFNGEIARVVVVAGRVSNRQVTDTSLLLGDLYGVSVTPQHPVTQSTGTVGGTHDGAARWWVPDTDPALVDTLIIYSHQAGAGSAGHQVQPSFVTYPALHGFVQEGWAVVAPLAYSSSSGDNWGSTRGMEHTKDAYDFMVGLFPNITKVGVVGLSMGGLISSLLVAGVDVTVPNIKAAALIDGVTDLADMHGNASYTSAIRTAYGVAGDGSDYATKTSGHDPTLRDISDFTGVRWRFYADSANDTTVPPADHAEAFSAALLAANPPAPEAVVVDHTGGHLSGRGVHPIDLIAFFNRGFA